MTSVLGEALERAASGRAAVREEALLHLAMLLEMNTRPVGESFYDGVLPPELRTLRLSETDQHEIVSRLKVLLLSTRRSRSMFAVLSEALPSVALPTLLEILATERLVLDWEEAWEALRALAKLLDRDKSRDCSPIGHEVWEQSPVPFLNQAVKTGSRRLVEEARACLAKVGRALESDATIHTTPGRGVTARIARKAIARHRREVLIGLNDSHYFSMVIKRTIYEVAGEYRDRLFLERRSLFHRPGVERIFLRETLYHPTNGSWRAEEVASGAIDLTSYLVNHRVEYALMLWRPNEWVGVDEEGIFVAPRADSAHRERLLPMSIIKRLFPGFTLDGVVADVFAEREFYFVVLQFGSASWGAAGLQKLVPVQRADFARATARLESV